LVTAARYAHEYEVIVIDDGSSDETARVAAELADGDPHVRLMLHPGNRGYGAALRTGIDAARLPWVLITDADLQFDLRALADFPPVTREARPRRRLASHALRRSAPQDQRGPMESARCHDVPAAGARRRLRLQADPARAARRRGAELRRGDDLDRDPG